MKFNNQYVIILIAFLMIAAVLYTIGGLHNGDFDNTIVYRDGDTIYAVSDGIVIFSGSDVGYVINNIDDSSITLLGDLGTITETINMKSGTHILFDSVVIDSTPNKLIFNNDNVEKIKYSGSIIISGNDIRLFEQLDSDNIKWIADTNILGSTDSVLFNGWKGNNIEIANIKADNFNGDAVFMNAGNNINVHDFNLTLSGTFLSSINAIIFIHSNQPETISNWNIEDITIDGTNSGDERRVAIAVNGNRAAPWGHDITIKNIHIKNYYQDGLNVINLYNSKVNNFNYDNGAVGGIFVCSDKTIISNSKVSDTIGSGYVFGDPGCPGRSYSDFKLIDSTVINSGEGFMAHPPEGTEVSEILIDNLNEYDNDFSIKVGADTSYGYILGYTHNITIQNTDLNSPTYFGDKSDGIIID